MRKSVIKIQGKNDKSFTKHSQNNTNQICQPKIDEEIISVQDNKKEAEIIFMYQINMKNGKYKMLFCKTIKFRQ